MRRTWNIQNEPSAFSAYYATNILELRERLC